ncbi:MAG TPA: hypothetical protein DCL77_15560, partial [Prolixibacteraceae bacterium]|nr:hypothetical protein [Prolixibacteraceae bacterium]
MISMNIQSPGDALVKKLTEVPFKKKQIKTGHPSTYADDLKLLHELQVQQLEMEMHNEDLRADQLTLEELHQKHTELFEFAPNGYFSLTPEGVIQELNLTGATLLGMPKGQLIHQRFINFIHPEDQETFHICWFNLMETHDYQVFKIRLSKPEGHQLYVKIALAIGETKRGFQILLAMTDVTMVKQIEDAQTFLLGCSWSISGKDFFCALAEYLAKSLGMDYVSIDKFLDDNLHAQTVAVYSDGHYQENSIYPVNETALRDLIPQRSFCFPREVQSLFPHDLTLEKTSAESYTGVTLWGSQGKAIGLIVLIGRKPLADARLTEMVLKQVSIRAAAELEHRQLEEAIIQSRDKLE